MSHRFSFPLKALAVLTLVVLIDQGVGFVSRHIIQGLDDKLSQIGSIQQALMYKRSDVLILGASCAKYHYDSQILADSLQMTVENTGVGGMKAEYSDLVLQSYLERCTPRCVVIDVYGQLDSGEGRLPRVRPFYGVNEPVTSYYDNESDWQQRLKLQSALYRYNGTLDLLLRHVINEPNHSHGFAEMEGEMSMKDTVVVHRFQPDSTKERHLRHVVQLCRDHNVRLVFVLSPRREHDADQEAWVCAFCREHHLQLINELHVPEYYTGEKLFHDESHLNGRGATLFSQRIAHQLKNS